MDHWYRACQRPEVYGLCRQQQWTDDHAGEEILLQKADFYQEHLGFADILNFIFVPSRTGLAVVVSGITFQTTSH